MITVFVHFRNRYETFSVRCRELSQLTEVYAIVNVDNEDKGLEKVQITEDGQLLALSGVSGTVHVYLTKLPVLGDAYRTKIACLSSLTEITVTNDIEQVNELNELSLI